MTRDQRNALLASRARATLAPLEAQRARIYEAALAQVEEELHRYLEKDTRNALGKGRA